MTDCTMQGPVDVLATRAQRRQLTLFMTRRMSLDKWSQLGILNRELALYERLYQNGIDVAIVSYGGAEESSYVQQFPWLKICYNLWNVPRWLYTRWLPLLHASAFRRTTWFKTNQASGGALAAEMARRFKRPLIARMGYLWSDTEARRHGDESVQVVRSRREEELLYARASEVVVTTRQIHGLVVERVPPAMTDRVRVIPNFVDTQSFRPQPDPCPEWDLIYVGRLSVEKNVHWILEAAERSDWRVLLIGSADTDLPHSVRVATRSKRVRWIPKIPNEDLPGYLAKSRVFVSASNGEGHPKAMLEALACGVPVIATKVPGVQDLFEHRRTAFLCSHTVEDLHQGLCTLLADQALQQQIGRIGRDFVEREFSLEQVVALELQMLNELTHAPGGVSDGRTLLPFRFRAAASA